MKLKFGAIVTDGVNKIGGHVVQSNHYGRFLRTRVTPTLVQNDYTAAQRSNLTALNQAWKDLSESDREDWIAATPDFPRQNAFGDTYYPTGKNLFMWVNRNLHTISSGPLTHPPFPGAPAKDYSFSLIATESPDAFEVSPVDTSAYNSQRFIVFATRSLSPGINYVSTELRLIHVFDGNGSGSYEFRTEYHTKFGAYTVGSKIFCRIIAVGATNGMHSIAYTSKAIIT